MFPFCDVLMQIVGHLTVDVDNMINVGVGSASLWILYFMYQYIHMNLEISYFDVLSDKCIYYTKIIRINISRYSFSLQAKAAM